MISQVQTIAGKADGSAYQLKVVLIGSKPSIWRRLQVPGNANLGWLHAVLQVAMGWTNSHLHHFIIGETRYSDPRFHDGMGFNDEPDADEAKAILARVVPNKPGFRFEYEYDFGDSWGHGITVERAIPSNTPAPTAAVCLDGARACPPEDCGGVWGYDNLLKILKNRKHPEHRDMKEWIGGAWDAEAFDLAKTNMWLRNLKWPRATDS